MCNNLEELQDVKVVNQTIQVGNGQKIHCTKAGTWKGIYKDQNGKEIKMKLSNVTYVSGLMTNLLSLTHVVESRWELQGTKGKMIVKKGNKMIKLL